MMVPCVASHPGSVEWAIDRTSLFDVALTVTLLAELVDGLLLPGAIGNALAMMLYVFNVYILLVAAPCAALSAASASARATPTTTPCHGGARQLYWHERARRVGSRIARGGRAAEVYIVEMLNRDAALAERLRHFALAAEGGDEDLLRQKPSGTGIKSAALRWVVRCRGGGGDDCHTAKHADAYRLVTGNGKTDVAATEGGVRIQVKKTKVGQSGQLCRHAVSKVVRVAVPRLGHMPDSLVCLVHMCDGARRVPLTAQPPESLRRLLSTLDNSRADLLDLAFRGTEPMQAPNVLAIVVCDDGAARGTCSSLVTTAFVRIPDVLRLLMDRRRYPMYVPGGANAGGRSIRLGNVLSIQRKGGDAGAPSADDLQFKLVGTRLLLSHHRSELPRIVLKRHDGDRFHFDDG